MMFLPASRSRSTDGWSCDWGGGHIDGATDGTIQQEVADLQMKVFWVAEAVC